MNMEAPATRRIQCKGCAGRTKKSKAKRYCNDCMVDMGYISTKNVYLKNDH